MTIKYYTWVTAAHFNEFLYVNVIKKREIISSHRRSLCLYHNYVLKNYRLDGSLFPYSHTHPDRSFECGDIVSLQLQEGKQMTLISLQVFVLTAQLFAQANSMVGLVGSSCQGQLFSAMGKNEYVPCWVTDLIHLKEQCMLGSSGSREYKTTFLRVYIDKRGKTKKGKEKPRCFNKNKKLVGVMRRVVQVQSASLLFNALLDTADFHPQLMRINCLLEAWSLLNLERTGSDFTQLLTFGRDVHNTPAPL